jgi:hypothetical protein
MDAPTAHLSEPDRDNAEVDHRSFSCFVKSLWFCLSVPCLFTITVQSRPREQPPMSRRFMPQPLRAKRRLATKTVLRVSGPDTPEKRFFCRSVAAGVPACDSLKPAVLARATGTWHAIGPTRPCGLGAICNWVKVMDEEARAVKPTRGFSHMKQKKTARFPGSDSSARALKVPESKQSRIKTQGVRRSDQWSVISDQKLTTSH